MGKTTQLKEIIFKAEEEELYLQEIFQDIVALNEVIEEEIKQCNKPLNLNEQIDIQLTGLLEHIQSESFILKEIHKNDLKTRMDNLQSQKQALINHNLGKL